LGGGGKAERSTVPVCAGGAGWTSAFWPEFCAANDTCAIAMLASTIPAKRRTICHTLTDP
jgi:hypothetical protein